MSKQYLDENGLAYLWEKVKNLASGKVDKENGKVLSSNDYTSTEKTKLAGIASGAQVNVIEGIQIGGDAVTLTNKIGNIPVMGAASSSAVGTKGVVPAPASGDQGKFLRGDATWQSISEGDPNQNAFSNVKVGSTTIAADTTTDTLEIVAGSNITLTPDATNDKLTIDATDTTYSEATTSAAGLMSSDDKTKLNGIATNAQVNQYAFSNVKIGDVTIAADTTTDTLELVAGSNISLTPIATNDKVTIAATYTNASLGQGYGIDNSTRTATSRYVTLSDYVLTVGGIVAVKHNNGISSSGASLNINNRGAKPIMYRGAALNGGIINGDETATYVYDGTYYQLISIGRDYLVNNSGDGKTVNIAIGTINYPAISTSAIGAASGVCPLNSSSIIDSQYLPSFVDDVIESYARSDQTALSSTWLATGSATGDVITPETGKIYILMADSGDYSANDQFRWGGTTYVKLSDGGVSAITNAEIDTICV